MRKTCSLGTPDFSSAWPTRSSLYHSCACSHRPTQIIIPYFSTSSPIFRAKTLTNRHTQEEAIFPVDVGLLWCSLKNRIPREHGTWEEAKDKCDQSKSLLCAVPGFDNAKGTQVNACPAQRGVSPLHNELHREIMRISKRKRVPGKIERAAKGPPTCAESSRR